MNRERLKMVRDRIAAEPPELLRMKYVATAIDCRMARCIAGWTSIVGKNTRRLSLPFAKDFLELTHRQSEELFLAKNSRIPLDKLTQADALAALDSLIHADSDDALPIWPEARP